MKSKFQSFFLGTSERALQSLALLRIVISSLLIFQALLLSVNIQDFYTSNGILHPVLNDIFSAKPFLPKLSWFVSPLASLGVSELTAVTLIYTAYVTFLFFLLLGWKTRFAALVACFFHLQIYSSGYYSAYGVDRYTHLFLFYFILIPSSEFYSVATYLGRKEKPSAQAFGTLCLRVLQAHLLLTYVGAGLEKALGSDWQQGEAIWRALMLPGFGLWNVSWLPFVPWVSWIGSYATIILEIFYPVAVMFRRVRPWWVMGICSMHFGIATTMGMVYFSAVMIALNLILFLGPNLLAVIAASVARKQSREMKMSCVTSQP